MTSTLDEDYRIYYRKETKWIALGQFNQAMMDDDACEWQMSDNQTPELHLLIVSLFKFQIMFLRLILKSQSSYNGPVTGSHYVPSTTSKASVHISTPIASGSRDVGSLSARQIDFMSTLDMDQGLVGKKGTPSSLETIWKRYVVINNAFAKINNIDWESGIKKPSQSEIVSVYSGKSTYYEQSKVLQHVKVHPTMIEWLERSDSDLDATTELWGFYKTMYTVKDLEKWLERKNEEAQKGKKGKKKVTVQPSPSSVKKSHKKSAGGRKQ